MEVVSDGEEDGDADDNDDAVVDDDDSVAEEEDEVEEEEEEDEEREEDEDEDEDEEEGKTGPTEAAFAEVWPNSGAPGHAPHSPMGATSVANSARSSAALAGWLR